MPQALKELHGGEELCFCFIQLITKVAARRLPSRTHRSRQSAPPWDTTSNQALCARNIPAGRPLACSTHHEFGAAVAAAAAAALLSA